MIDWLRIYFPKTSKESVERVLDREIMGKHVVGDFEYPLLYESIKSGELDKFNKSGFILGKVRGEEKNRFPEVGEYDIFIPVRRVPELEHNVVIQMLNCRFPRHSYSNCLAVYPRDVSSLFKEFHSETESERELIIYR